MTGIKQRWLLFVMLAVILVSISGWWITRDRLPAEIRIGTGYKGGQYYELMSYIKPYLESATGSQVRIRETAGSVENAILLDSDELDFAILQLGPVGIGKHVVVTPLYPEIVHVVVRSDSKVQRFDDLKGHTVAISSRSSGMHLSAEQLLMHYGWDMTSDLLKDAHFLDLEKDATLDAAIVTSGFMNPDLAMLLATKRYKLLPLDAAAGLTIRQPFFSKYVIPRGLYRGGEHALPKQDIDTVSTMAVLVAKSSVSPGLVNATLNVLYQTETVYKFPGLLNRTRAAEWDVLPKNSTAAAFFNPYEGIDILTSFLESLAAGKELLFALGAALYLLWDLSRRRKEKYLTQSLVEQKERLDKYLQNTITIERRQLHEKDPERLSGYLDEVTKIKLAALEEFTTEDLRADRSFSIFLRQCANLIMKIQIKINLLKG